MRPEFGLGKILLIIFPWPIIEEKSHPERAIPFFAKMSVKSSPDQKLILGNRRDKMPLLNLRNSVPVSIDGNGEKISPPK